MNNQEHIKRHKELHKSFDELLADFLANGGSIRKPITELMSWSYKQTHTPDDGNKTAEHK